MSKDLLIGVRGHIGSGKTAFADYLAKSYGFYKLAFSGPLKEMAKIAFDFSDKQLYGSQEDKETPDERYPFSGFCPSCFHLCTSLRGGSEWWCPPCDTSYPAYVTPRLAMQTLGTEWGRTLCRDLWIRNAFRRIDEKPGCWVIHDVRFRNEIDAIRNRGGVIIRLLRGEARFNHASEQVIEEEDHILDHVLDNRGLSLDEFHAQIDGLVAGLQRA